MSNPLPDLEILDAQSGDVTVRAGEHWLDDPLDPILAAITFSKSFSPEGRDCVVVFGHGMGYRVARLRDLGAPRLIVYEPDAELTGWVRENLPGMLDGATVLHDPDALAEMLATDEAGRPLRTSFSAHRAYTLAYPDAYAGALAAVQAGRARASARLKTLSERLPSIVEAVVRNVPRARGASSVGQVGRVLEGQTAFVISAGPSLDRNRHLLREAARKGVIVATGTALPVLRAEGVAADVLVVVDPVWKTEDIDGTDSGVRSLAVDLCADARVHGFDVPRITYTQHTYGQGFETPDAPLGMIYGASVATACVSLADALGAANVVLVGQDCAHTGGRSYARGLGRDDFLVEILPRSVRYVYPAWIWERVALGTTPSPLERAHRVDVPAWDGEGMVATTADLETFRQWFVQWARHRPGPRRLNASEGGARIEGWESQPLAEVLAGLPERSVDLAAAMTAAPRLPVDAMLANRRTIVARLRKGITAGRNLLRGGMGASARDRAKDEIRGLMRDVPQIELHARGAIFAHCGATEEPDPRVVIRSYVNSMERLLPCYLST